MSTLQQLVDLLARAYTPVFYDVLRTAGGVLTALGLSAVTLVSLASDLPFATGIVYLATFVGSILALFSLGRLAVVAAGSASKAMSAGVPFFIITLSGCLICFSSQPPLSAWWIVGANVGVYALILMCNPFATSDRSASGKTRGDDERQPDPFLRDLEHISHRELKVRRRGTEKVLARNVTSLAFLAGNADDLASADDVAMLRRIVRTDVRRLRILADMFAARFEPSEDEKEKV